MSTTTNWIPYYNMLYVQQQQREHQAEKDKKEAEQKSEKVQQNEEPVKECKNEETDQEFVHQTEIKEEKSKEQEKIVENTSKKEEIQRKKEVKLDDCDAIYEMDSTEYVLCELTKAQEQQTNMMIALTFVTCIVLAGIIVAAIISCINRNVDREDERRKKNGGSGFTIV